MNKIPLLRKTSIKEKKSTVQTTNYSTINTFNNILFILYYILLFLVVVLVVISSKLTNINVYVKIAIVVLLAIFPFVYLWIELFIWKIVKYTFNMIAGHVRYEENDKERGNLLRTQLFTS
jgi:CBS domain containing-hemolysin-like protein